MSTLSKEVEKMEADLADTKRRLNRAEEKLRHISRTNVILVGRDGFARAVYIDKTQTYGFQDHVIAECPPTYHFEEECYSAIHGCFSRRFHYEGKRDEFGRHILREI